MHVTCCHSRTLSTHPHFAKCICSPARQAKTTENAFACHCDALLLLGRLCEHAGMFITATQSPRKMTPVNDFVSSLSRGSRPFDALPLSGWCLLMPLCATKLLFWCPCTSEITNQWVKKPECGHLEGHLLTPLSPCCAQVWPSTLQLTSGLML